MRRIYIVTLIGALALAGITPTAARAEGRLAVIVGSDDGVGGDARLRHTRSDIDRVAETLIELGGFAADDVIRVPDADAPRVLEALDAAQRRRPDLFVFYYSGHADIGALRLGETRLPVELLLRRIASTPARLRIAVLDACQSGAAARPRTKGVSPGPPFEVRVEPDMAAGQVVIASSAADEVSFESDTHGGSVFTLHWTTGLRGAADDDGDGRVTLTEAWRYAHDRTVGETLLARDGPQRPTFRLDIAGRRDPVLTTLDAASTVTLRAEREAHYLVFDGAEQRLVADVGLVRGEQRRLALTPGTYTVKRRTADALYVARVRLGAGEQRRLYDHRMPAVPLVELAPKSAWGTRWISATVGQYMTPLADSGHLRGALGLEWEGHRWLVETTLGVSSGPQTPVTVPSRLTVATLSGAASLSWRPGQVTVRAGAVGGLALLVQAPDGLDTRVVPGALAGGRLRLDIPLSGALGITARGDVLAFATRAASSSDDGPPLKWWAQGSNGLAVMPWLAYGVGLRFGW